MNGFNSHTRYVDELPEVEINDEEAKVYAEHLIRQIQLTDGPSWDTISEGYRVDRVLDHDSCQRVRDAIHSADIIVRWLPNRKR